MPSPTHFSRTDIGGEILPILTTGLYRDTLDALREYIQNAIDADTSDIELVIDPSTIAIADSGVGMSRTVARNAIRLGISDKNPIRNVGFRGIGIYSAFNLCNLLEIYTKSEGERAGSRIVFDFGAIRKRLLVEQEKRKAGAAPELFLEKLLESTVYVEDDTHEVISHHGTQVILSDLLPESYRPVQDWDTVVSYLEDVVPLPFHPDFRYGKKIQKKFDAEDYRVVPLTLQINSRRELVYRPYRDDAFTDNAAYPPKFFTISKGKNRFGFAWVCVNGRRVIRDQALRGLLIKKFGFSIGNRSYLEPLFKRTVFHRRITGEIVIKHPGLLPNAARSDFESNLARQEFMEALPAFLASITKWANDIQEYERASQVLSEVRTDLESLANRIALESRDKEAMLRAAAELSDHERRLATHKKTLQTDGDLGVEYLTTTKLLKSCRKLVHDALTTSHKSQAKLEKDVIDVVQSEYTSRHTKVKAASEEPPTDLRGALERCGIHLPVDVERAISVFERECLLTQLDSATYKKLLEQLVDVLEEEL